MYDTRALAYVMEPGAEVFAISISMKASDGVALPVAVMAAVAAVVPVMLQRRSKQSTWQQQW